MTLDTGLLEEPLPKPRRDLVSYAGARTLESLLESLLSLEFLGKGYTRNAAGKAFQAWKALLGALLALNRDKLEEILGNREQVRWLEEIGIPRVPTAKLKRLAQLLERAGYKYISFHIDKALDLHDYQYHGPDPSGELSKYTSRGEAAEDIILLLEALVELVERRVKPVLESVGQWTDEHSQALRQLEKRISTLKGAR